MLDVIGERLAKRATVRADRFGVAVGLWMYPLFSVSAGVDFKLRILEIRFVFGDAEIV